MKEVYAPGVCGGPPGSDEGTPTPDNTEDNLTSSLTSSATAVTDSFDQEDAFEQWITENPDYLNGNIQHATLIKGARGGPRLISIPRCGDQGFGFTLRHFIVYPPEISELLSGNVSLECGLSSLDPLDTIFIKNVKRGGAAHRAGLRTGDRVVSVNGENVTGRSYQEVVGIIQLSPPFLQLMVVPREQDLLQQVFGDTAHNPESNLDLNRVQSPLPHELPSYPHNQQYAHPHPPLYPHHNQYGPQFPSPFPQGTESLSSSWSSETSLSSYPIMSSGPHPPPQQQQQQPIPPFHGHHHPIQQNVSGQPIRRPTPRAPTLRHPVPHPAPHPPPMRHPAPSTMHRPPPPHGAQMPIQHNAQQPRGVAAVNRSNSRKPSLTADKVAAAAGGGSRRQSLPVVTDRRQAVYTIQNSLTSVPQHVPSPGPGTPSPIPGSTNIPAGTPAPAHLASNDQAGAQPSQAPGPSLAGVYEPIMDRATGIRASIKDSRRLERDPDGRVYEVVKTRIVESGPGKPNPNVKNGAPLQRSASSVGEAESKRVRRQSLSPPRLKTDINNAGGRSTSACRSNAGLHNGSVQSLNSLQNEVPVKSRRPRPYGQRSNTEPLYASIDAVHSNDKLVIERIKRNVDRKEEFLNRPAQPIWLPSSKAPGVHRDYHVSPQKMPKPQWPPPAQTPPSPGSITKALSVVAAKGEHHQLRRARSEIERCTRSNTRHGSFPNIQLVSQAETIIPSTSFTTDDLPLSRSSQISPPSSLVSNGIPKPYNGTTTATISTSDPAAAAAAAAARYGKAFVTTLSRIQENIPAQELGSQSSLASTTTQGTRICDSTASSLMGTPFGSQSSLNSPSSRSIPLAWVGDNERIKQLQIVSKRAKQFENREDKENFAKSAFQRFELTRLSQRSKVPNVAKMKEELDKKDDSSLKVAGFGYELGLQFNTPRQRKSVDLTHARELSSPDYAPSPPKVFRSLSDGGNVFPVSRRLYCSPQEESPTAMRARDHQILIMGGVGNRAMPIGGGRIHCEPPGGFNIRPYSDPDVLDREHSNSMESGVSMWSVQSAEETRTKHKSSSGQNNSYRMNTGLSPGSVATPTPPTPEDGTVTPVVTPGATPTTATPTNASSPSNAITPTIITSTSNHLQPVHRRTKHLYDDEGERLVRRVSYLKATSGDRMYSDSDLDSDSEEHRSLRVDGGLVAAAGILSAATPLGPLCCMDLPSPASLQSAVVRQGNLHVKLTMVDGKKAGDRSWKTVWAVVQGRALIFYKDRQHATQTPLGCEEQISLRGADVEVASDYTKRRNVMRLSTHGGSQLLLQPDTQADMVAWLSTIHHNITQDSTDGTKGSINNNNVSPQSSTKSSHKHNSTLRTRSPTGQSPSTKTRKASSTDSSSSPKNKTWKGRIGRHLRKMHAGSPSNPPSTSLPEGATIGVCLEDCPQSEDNECVPLLVSLCIKVVEERGMQTQGIYRIPGNKAAVTHLTETINNGQNCIDHTDPRWSDVNVISSMLKQFFQKLPDPLVTMEYYSAFIEASKTEDPSQRMLEIKKVIHELPDHHYETMRYLMMHLADIVKSCEFNKMDVKNLAIVFGPTIVRSGDDNMVTMVTDMSHQCRIVETIISHAEWYFNDDECDEDSLPILVAAASAAQQVRSPMEELGMSSLCDNEFLRDSNATTPSSQDLLLGNINKLDGSAKGDYKKDLFSSVISAANRKVNKVKHKRPTEGHNKSVDDKLEKESFEERDIDKETELRKQRTVHKQMENMVELPDPKPMSQRKISSMSLMSVQSNAQSVQSSVKDNSQNNQLLPNLDSSSERTSGISDSSKLPNSVDDGRLFCVVKKDSVDKTNSSVHPTTSLSSAVVSSVSSSSSSSIQQQSSQALGDSSSSTSSLLGDDVAIRSYAGLSASTQERIRRFEMETRAMLHRDMLRHRKETEKRAVERSQLEEALQRAKQDMESDDILDQLADNPTDMVRKISDYSWRLQSQSEHGSGSGPTSGLSGVLGTSGSSSNGSSDGANISSGQHTTVQHSHPPNPSPLTPSTNAITQVSNTPLAAAATTLGAHQPTLGLMCDSSATNTSSQSVLNQASTQRWCDLNLSSSPHSTLGSTYSSSSSGYGSLTRSSQSSSNTKELDEFDGKMVELRIEEASSSDESSSASKPYSRSYSQISGTVPLTTSQQQINSGNFPYELSYSSSSPSVFFSMNESSGELTPTRKIGQTSIYPKSPRQPIAPPHIGRNISNITPRGSLGILPPVGGPTGGGGGSRLLSGRSSHTGAGGRHKDSLLHHILPSRLYHSPRPLRRGSSAENVTQTPSTQPPSTTTFLQPPSSGSFDTGKVANNGTLKRGARAAHDQHMVPSLDIPRCSSLDSLRDPSAAASHDDGSDLLSAITATFEEKMRSLQDSPLSLMHSESDSDVSDTARKDSSSRGEKFGQCRLYRDPSLHRRRSSGPRHAHGNNTTPNSQVKETSPNRNLSEGCNPGSVTKSGNASNNKQLKEDNKRDNKVKRSDSLTKSEKTENNLKEKTEKRARDLKRTDTQESINEKKPKEMKRSDIQEKESLLKSSSTSPKKSDNQDGPNTSNRRSSASNNRKTNVKELKEKFEQNSPVGGSMKSSANSNNNNVANNKGGKLGMRRHRGPIKRRHTVGGTKDLAKWAWLQSGGEVSPRHQKANNRVSAWERLQPLVADEKLNTDRSLETWLARERIRTSSPDLSRPQPLVLHCDIDDKENIHRRFSVQEVAVAVSPLYPVLESHV